MATKVEETESKNEESEELLLTLYRFAYNVIGENSISDEIKNGWSNIVDQFPDDEHLKTIKNAPDSARALLEAIRSIPPPEDQESKPEDKKPTKDDKKEDAQELVDVKGIAIKLEKICESDHVDDAMMMILQYKLNDENRSAKAICEFQIDQSGGWTSRSSSAIHQVIRKMDRWGTKETPESKNKRRLFLYEVFLREGISTQNLRAGQSGWGVRSENNNVWESTLNCNNEDALTLILQYGADVDVNTTCTSNGSSNKSSQYSSWKPIHKAIQNNNMKLVGQLLKKGAVITEYYLSFYQHDYGAPRDTQSSTAYLIQRGGGKHEMIKFLLKHCDSKVNGFMDVNKYNVKTVNEDRLDYEILVKRQKTLIKYDGFYKVKTEDGKFKWLQHGVDGNDVADGDDVELDLSPPKHGEAGYDRWHELDYYRSEDYIQPTVYVYHYETMLHVAVRECDIEMIKILMVYGADTTLKRVRSRERASFHQGYGYGGRGSRELSAKERKKVIQEFCEQATGQGDYEETLDLMQILQRAECKDVGVKKEIEKLLASNRNWFPELFDYYPMNQGPALKFMYEEWETPLPLDVVGIIAKFFYSVFEDDLDE